MSYVLGSLTLPAPVEFNRETVETSVENLLLTGTTKKDIVNRKERFVLRFEHLTSAEVSSIMAEYDLQTVRNFAVSETNVTITSTQVHIDITNREYVTGADYRENLTIILIEVQ